MLIIGAGGFAFQSLDVYISNNKSLDELVFFDDVSKDVNPYLNSHFKVIRSFNELDDNYSDFEFILGIGTPKNREYFFNKLTKEYNGNPYNLICEKSAISTVNTILKKGVTIMSGCNIMPNCMIGNGVLINCNVTLGHDTIVNDFVEISPGVNISGNCNIGKNVFIGTGAILIPKITIGEGAVIAAGAVVIQDVPAYTMFAGNPAIKKKDLK